MKSAFIRPIFDFILLCSFFMLPWWATCIFSIAGLVYFDYYIEIMFIGFFFDVMFAPKYKILDFSSYKFMISFSVAFFIAVLVKSKMRIQKYI